ncbi:MAG: hypothetical protein NC121_07145 [Blautia sp.]|nr:hypothetical protein [Blautia sp.]
MDVIARHANMKARRRHMQQETDYILPRKNRKLSRNGFIAGCMLLSCICASFICFLIVPLLAPFCCGFIPGGLVSLISFAAHIGGTVFYISKHKYVYGEDYQLFQVVNSVVYGIQNVLRVLLISFVFSICIVPVSVIFLVVYMCVIVTRMFRRR